MLLQNPQLGYALLQAQVIMKIVDPEVAKVFINYLCTSLYDYYCQFIFNVIEYYIIYEKINLVTD